MSSTVCHKEREAAQILGISIKTLQAWRWQSRGPTYVKLGRRIGYLDSDLMAFMDKCRVEPANSFKE